jgi:membrane associated rhomboid family serine protease
MTEPKPIARAAGAGALVLATILLCIGVGYGIGTLIGAAAPLAIVGVFAGFVAGFFVVRARFEDL